MKYKDAMEQMYGIDEKKKAVKKQPKTVSNPIVETIKEEISEYPIEKILNEVGAAPLYRKHIKNIDKYRDQVGRETLKFYDLLRKKGLDDAADELLDKYKNYIIRFGKDLKQLVRKLM